MRPGLLAAADRQRDEGLSIQHVELAEAIRDGRPQSAARIARAVARRELTALDEALG